MGTDAIFIFGDSVDRDAQLLLKQDTIKLKKEKKYVRSLKI